MTVIKAIAGIALFAALLAPAAQAGYVEQAWLPRAMPSDYAAVANALPRAMPADYGRAGVTLIESVGMPRAMPSDYATYLASTKVEPRGGFDWVAAAIGAAGTLGLVLLGTLGATLVRRGSRLRTA
jgi:hypothetical protein